MGKNSIINIIWNRKIIGFWHKKYIVQIVEIWSKKLYISTFLLCNFAEITNLKTYTKIIIGKGGSQKSCAGNAQRKGKNKEKREKNAEKSN